jgi:hypothetical protein
VEDADARRLGGAPGDVGEGKRERRIVSVMGDDAVGIDARRVADDETPVVPDVDAGTVIVEHDGSTVFEADLILLAAFLVSEDVERAVVEDVAVLIDLDERRSRMRRGLAKHLGEVSPIVVEGAGHEARLRAERDRDRVERMVERAEGRRLRDLPLLAGG